MRKAQTLLIVLMVFGSLGVCLIIGVILSMPGGPLERSLSLPQPEQESSIRVFAQTPPQAVVDEEFQTIIIVQNLGQESVHIEEIRLPENLLQAAIVLDISPGTLSQRQYEGNTGFQINYDLAPGERQTIEITMLPRSTAEVIAEVQAVTGSEVTSAHARWMFAQAVAIQPSTATPTITITPSATPTLVPPTLTPTPRIPIPYQAVVKLTAKVKYSSYLKAAWQGSGTIISPDGLILTNAHLVLGPPGLDADYFIISMTVEPDRPSVDSFLADVLYTDKDLDLALMRITTDLKYKEVNPETLNLTSVPLGDSDLLELGDPIIVLGYPGIGGDTITLTRGTVGGFTSQKAYGERAWIKTSTSITGGTSGGLVLDQYGRMIAIPSQLGYGTDNIEDMIDCQNIADTNDDGIINSLDECVPSGGFINALRPINLAIPIIERFKSP